MSDPYKVLGVSPNATDDEIKTAYRELAKKYHPDNYAESPLADLASEKMKEINEAYDTIMNDRKARANNGGYQQNGYGGYQGGYQYKKGWMEEAYNNFSTACNMDPGNMEYRAAMNQCQNQRNGAYGGYNRTAPAAGGCNACDMCSSLICADCCCECMGGDLISCC